MLVTEIGSLLFVASAMMLDGGSAMPHKQANDRQIKTDIVAGGPTLAPFQHVRFCIRYPADCKVEASDQSFIELTAATRATLEQVNRQVNASISPIEKVYGTNLGDSWTINPYAGDCNDYAVSKRHELIARGLPAKAMSLAVVRTRSGIGHLVLTIVTDKGTLVLDNLTESIKPWTSAGYRWLKVQSHDDPRFWHDAVDIKPVASLPGPKLSSLR